MPTPSPGLFSLLRLLDFLPMLHTAAEDRWFIANVILKDCEVTVAEDESKIVSFLAIHDGSEVRLLHTHRTGSAWVRARN